MNDGPFIKVAAYLPMSSEAAAELSWLMLTLPGQPLWHDPYDDLDDETEL